MKFLTWKNISLLFNKRKFEKITIACIAKQKWQKIKQWSIFMNLIQRKDSKNAYILSYQIIAWFFSFLRLHLTNFSLDFPSPRYGKLLFSSQIFWKRSRKRKGRVKEQNKANGWRIWDRNYLPHRLIGEIYLDRWSLSSLPRREWSVYIIHGKNRIPRTLEVEIESFSYFTF